MSKKILLVGWDAADWKVIHPLLDAGQMPNLEHLVNEGVIGNLATLYPVLSPMLWTSIATGKRAFKHGICGFIEPDSQTGGVRPITNLSRKTKAVWNILNQSGKKCNVVGWWPSHPAEPINGVMVSDQYHRAPVNPKNDWPFQPRTVHPSHLAPHLARLRIHPTEIDGDMLLPFVPRAAEIDQQADTRLFNLAKVIAECSSIHAAATAIMQLEPWDFMAVYYDAIDHFSHGFMKYHPPRLDWVKEEDFELYQDVVRGAYRFHDLMLGTLLSLVDDDTTVIVMSDHGFHSDHLRPRILPNEPVGPAAEHRALGILVIRGPGIKRDERIHGATLLDICPTILHLFGLPIGRDMDGRVLTAASEDPPDTQFIDSWDQVDGPSGQHPPDFRLDAVEAQEAIQQLVALGYIDQPNEDDAVAAAEATRELNYHLAQAHIDAQQHRVAAEILNQLWTRWSDELRFGVALLQCQVALELTSEARATIDQIKSVKAIGMAQAIEEVKQFHDQHPERAFRDLPPKERGRIRRLQARAQMNRPALAYLEACVLQLERRYAAALSLLRSAAATEASGRVNVLLKMGEILLQLRRGAEAEARFRQVLALDPHNPQAYLGLCRRQLRQRRYASAAESARNSLGTLFHNPKAHYFHGIALRHCGKFDLAILALETALRQNPNFPRAHAGLAMIYDRHLVDAEKAEFHRKEAARVRQTIRQIRRQGHRLEPSTQPPGATPGPMHSVNEVRRPELSQVPPRDFVVIVSGLPRSGTSMMMQMLQAGGIPIRSDGKREADENNPKGYLELDEVKGLAKDAKWVAEARGQAVKVVAQLVPFLPPRQHYKFVFMDRDLDEVLRSQSEMLDRLDQGQTNVAAETLRKVYQKHLGQAKSLVQRNPLAEMITVAYREAIERPDFIARQVADFLAIPGLNPNAMARAVDGSLYRSRFTQNKR